jgi:hypothetical protein
MPNVRHPDLAPRNLKKAARARSRVPTTKSTVRSPLAESLAHVPQSRGAALLTGASPLPPDALRGTRHRPPRQKAPDSTEAKKEAAAALTPPPVQSQSRRYAPGLISLPSLESVYEPGKNGLPIEAGMLMRMNAASREISTSTMIVDT